MKSGLRRWFHKGHIPVPDSFDLPEEYVTTERNRYAEPEAHYHGQRWLLCSSRDHRVLAFSSDLDIEVVSRSTDLIMDGTFKTKHRNFDILLFKPLNPEFDRIFKNLPALFANSRVSDLETLKLDGSLQE
uniref:Uncharacterized protein n=1 Tax=Romanomermis culicivorax TaxID=13658 RepID=A0A915I059_ROMCU